MEDIEIQTISASLQLGLISGAGEGGFYIFSQPNGLRDGRDNHLCSLQDTALDLQLDCN